MPPWGAGGQGLLEKFIESCQPLWVGSVYYKLGRIPMMTLQRVVMETGTGLGGLGTRSVFNIIGKKMSHCLKRAQRFCYVNL